MLNPFWVIDSIREKELLPIDNYIIEVRISDILLRKRKYKNIRSESQESFESTKDNKNNKKEKSNAQRKSKFKMFNNKPSQTPTKGKTKKSTLILLCSRTQT